MLEHRRRTVDDPSWLADGPTGFTPHRSIPRLRPKRTAPPAIATTSRPTASERATTRPVGAAERPRSHARSGCGIRPTTLRAALQMPAMLSIEPFGLAASVGCRLRRRVAEDDPAVALRARPSHVGIGEVVPLAVRDRQVQHLARRRREVNGVSVCSTRTNDVLAEELQAAVAQHRAGQQPRLEQDLEAVADAQHRTAAVGERRAPPMTGEKRAIAPVRR